MFARSQTEGDKTQSSPGFSCQIAKVTPGRRIEVEFPNGKPSTKKSGEHSFVLKDLQNNERGIHVTLALPQLTKKRGNQFGNPQAMMKAVLEQQGAFEVLLQDSEGILHQ